MRQGNRRATAISQQKTHVQLHEQQKVIPRLKGIKQMHETATLAHQPRVFHQHTRKTNDGATPGGILLAWGEIISASKVAPKKEPPEKKHTTELVVSNRLKNLGPFESSPQVGLKKYLKHT